MVLFTQDILDVIGSEHDFTSIVPVLFTGETIAETFAEDSKICPVLAAWGAHCPAGMACLQSQTLSSHCSDLQQILEETTAQMLHVQSSYIKGCKPLQLHQLGPGLTRRAAAADDF